ncbi:helix-turn-helix transcriptional regulator [Sorangium sp. So ce296]|uniref:Cro/CI family transcriptional regulator n=2 Tax=Sorangium TaxID=39643 RepID=A0A4P2QYE3_SORCE|nr:MULTISPECIES: helix-turn-helix transcriptional regulator [Sorangium]AUX35266.1 Cro/CI family transcriptional regulator [Sorangium cellulosum]WCQ94570.1 transcriptional regulator [Sorangium sp. Soce836]
MPDARLEEVLRFIGANVRRIREKRGMTQQELADAAGIALRFLQKVEHAQSNVGVAVLVRLADVLGVRLGVLFRQRELPPVKRGRPRKARLREP